MNQNDEPLAASAAWEAIDALDSVLDAESYDRLNLHHSLRLTIQRATKNARTIKQAMQEDGDRELTA